MMESAQCLIAYMWRMNRIKIKLARKKREKEEAARKKAQGSKYKYSYNSSGNYLSIDFEYSKARFYCYEE
jgi:hypothetical protein